MYNTKYTDLKIFSDNKNDALALYIQYNKA